MNKIGPKKILMEAKNFLKSKANKLNMVFENDGFFSKTENLVNYFEEVYQVPHFKNKLCFKNNKIDDKVHKQKYAHVKIPI